MAPRRALGVERVALRVAQAPAQRGGPTSYLTLLATSLASTGVTVTSTDAAGLWRLGWERSVDLVHLHWLEFMAPSDPAGTAGLIRTAVRHLRLLAALLWLRARGIGLIWTVHNLRPHEPVRPRLESLLSRAVSRICHRLVAHSAYARERILERWGPRVNVAVIPHGNYLGRFPAARGTREEIRATLGIPQDAYVFLAFGQVRPYKRLAELADAFGHVGGEEVRLLVVGRPVVAEEAERLRRAASADPRIVLDLRAVPDDEVAGLHLCSDAAVLAYRDVFSSGALLLALSFGLPVVAPDVGTAAELVGDGAGVLFGTDGLAGALSRMRDADHAAHAQAAGAAAQRYGWDRVASETVALYRRVVSDPTA
jgi:beta-1,4-mannosyltransferase